MEKGLHDLKIEMSKANCTGSGKNSAVRLCFKFAVSCQTAKSQRSRWGLKTTGIDISTRLVLGV